MARIINITFACQDPILLSEFWAQAADYVPFDVPPEIEEWAERLIAEGKLDPTGWALLVPRAGDGPRLLFQRRPKSATESIPIHLDLSAEDRETEVERLTGLGATVVETKTSDTFGETWTVMRDPEGNGFCVQ